MSATVGIYNTAVESLFEPYIRPCENGSRADTRWVMFSKEVDPNGTNCGGEREALDFLPDEGANLRHKISQDSGLKRKWAVDPQAPISFCKKLCTTHSVACKISSPLNLPFSFSASGYSVSELDRCWHVHSLKSSDGVHVCVDAYMMGLGGDTGWKKSVHPEFHVKPGRFDFTFDISLG